MKDYITIIEIAILALGFLGNLFLPKKALQYVEWKQKKRGKEIPEKKDKELLYVTIAGELVYLALGIYWCIMFEPVSVLLNTAFYGFALFGTYVDAKIRIIGNEMLKAMLILVVIYKVAMYTNLNDLLLSFAGFGFIMAVFAVAAGINYLHRGSIGVGMGDIKLAMIAGLLAGWPGVLNMFIGLGMALAACIIAIPLFLKKAGDSGMFIPIKLSDHFAMCFAIMTGILFYLSGF